MPRPTWAPAPHHTHFTFSRPSTSFLPSAPSPHHLTPLQLETTPAGQSPPLSSSLPRLPFLVPLSPLASAPPSPPLGSLVYALPALSLSAPSLPLPPSPRPVSPSTSPHCAPIAAHPFPEPRRPLSRSPNPSAPAFGALLAALTARVDAPQRPLPRLRAPSLPRCLSLVASPGPFSLVFPPLPCAPSQRPLTVPSALRRESVPDPPRAGCRAAPLTWDSG